MNERWKKTDKPVKERERETQREQKRITNGKGQRKQMEKRSKGGNNIFFFIWKRRRREEEKNI